MLTLQNYVGNVQRNLCRSSLSSALLQMANLQEAQLVDRLRSDGAVIVSLVAVEDCDIVGHILFSDLLIETDQAVLHAVSLAPMAVAPKFQRRGIGSALVRHGLAVCLERGKSVVVVLGHPEYYPRFGFSTELAKSLR